MSDTKPTFLGWFNTLHFKYKALAIAIVIGIAFITVSAVILYLQANSITQTTNKKIEEQQKQIDKFRDEANQAKGVLNDTLKELEESKKQTQEEKLKRELAEKVFQDSSLTAAEKRKELEKIKNNPVNTPVNPDADLSQLCARAKQLGIECKE